MLSISLGFVAQRSLTGDADVQAHAAALSALMRVAAPSVSPAAAGQVRVSNPDIS